MKKIIIPVDFSEYSEYALQTGAMLAKKYNAELLVMHMLELSESLISASSSENNEETAFMLMVTKKNFEEFLDKDYLEGLTVTPIIKHHKVLKEVDKVASEVKADLVIMGSRGHNDFDGVFTGSNTEKVVRYSKTPVLVVKTKPKTVDFNHVVLASDFSEGSVSAVKHAYELLKKLANNVKLLHVNMPNLEFLSTDEIEEKIEEFVELTKQPDLKDHIVYVADHNVEDGLINYARKHNADMISIITEGRTGLSHFFGGSISEDVVNHSKLPVITFRK